MVDPSGLATFVVCCHLIALNIALVSRPLVCAGEVFGRIVCKAFLATVKDILETEGPLQLCASQDASSEAVIPPLSIYRHAMGSVFTKQSTELEAILLVVLSNNE